MKKTLRLTPGEFQILSMVAASRTQQRNGKPTTMNKVMKLHRFFQPLKDQFVSAAAQAPTAEDFPIDFEEIHLRRFVEWMDDKTVNFSAGDWATVETMAGVYSKIQTALGGPWCDSDPEIESNDEMDVDDDTAL